MNDQSTHKTSELLPDIIRVLHIDDEDDFLYLTKEFIEKMSDGEIVVESLKDTTKVIERLQSNEIDVIVCDYLMEDLNGLDLLKTIKKEELNIPFIIFTGRGREEVVIDALNLGADYYIRKGTDARSQYTELVHQIRTVLRHKKAEEALLKRELELKEERDLTKFYLNEASVMFVILNVDEEVELMNKTVTNVLGYSEKDLFGNNWFTTVYASEVVDEIRFGFQQVMIGMRKPLPYSEVEARTKSGEKRIIAWHNTAILDANGKVTKLLGVGEDITKRKEMEAALRDNEERYRSLVETSPYSIVLADMKGNVTYANQQAAAMHGVESPEELIGSTLLDFTAPEDHQRIMERMRSQAFTTLKGTFEYKMLRKDGTIFPVEMNATVLRGEDGKPMSLMSIARDLTETRAAEEAARESDARYRGFVENFTGIAFQGSIDFKPFFFHGAVEKITGYTEEDFVTGDLSWDKLVVPEDLNLLLSINQELHNTPGFSNIMEYRIRNKNGEIRWIRQHIQNLDTEINGDYIVNGSLYDITEEKSMEEELIRSETRYKNLVETSPDGIILTDLNGKIILANQQTAELYGTSDTNDLIDRHYKDYVHPDTLTKTDGYTATVLEKGKATGQEYRFIKKDNSSIFAEVNVTRIDDYAGNPIAFMSIIRDITERKESESKLKESEVLYRTIFESTGMANLIVSQDKIIKMVNSKFEELSGYSKSEIENKLSWTQILLQDDAIELEEYQRLHDQDPDLSPEYFEIKFKDKEGNTKEAYISVKTITGTTDFIVTVQDITKMKSDEQKLRESANLYKTLFEATGTHIAIANKETIVEIMNDRLAKFSGYSKEEVEGKMSWTKFVADSDLDRLKELNLRRLKDPSSVPERYEADLQNKKGEIFTCLVHVGLIPETDKYIISIIELTEIKKAEKELAKTADMYRTIFEATGTANIIMGPNRIVKQVNSKVEEVTGFKPDEILGKSWSQFVPEETMVSLLKFSRSRAQQTDNLPTYIETNFINKDGKVRDVILNLTSLPNSEDYIVSFFDITEMKETEEEIKKSEILYRTVFETTGMANVIYNKEATIVLVNSKMEKLSSYAKEEIEGKKWSEFIPHPELGMMVEYMRKRAIDPSSVPEQYETKFIDKTGNIIDILVAITTIPDSDNNLATVADISERQKEVDTLTKQKKELSDFAHLMAHDIRNCLSSIEGYIDLVLEDESESEQYLSRINKQTEYMRKLLDRSIELADAGQTVEKSETVDLNELVKSISMMTIPTSIKFSAEPLFSVRADKEKLSQIIKNIFENAVIHGEPREIEIRVQEKEDRTVLKIINDGKMINKEIINDAFESALTTKEKESVHGLAIVKKLIDAHNWQIILCEVTEKPCFDIVIPDTDIVRE